MISWLRYSLKTEIARILYCLPQWMLPSLEWFISIIKKILKSYLINIRYHSYTHGYLFKYLYVWYKWYVLVINCVHDPELLVVGCLLMWVTIDVILVMISTNYNILVFCKGLAHENANDPNFMLSTVQYSSRKLQQTICVIVSFLNCLCFCPHYPCNQI